MRFLTLTCANEACGRSFQKATNEHARQVRTGRSSFFCSRRCVQLGRDMSDRYRSTDHLPKGSERDALSQFRWFVARARARKHHGPTDLTPEYLKLLWDQQGGMCPFTGWSLILPPTSEGWPNGAEPRNASVDRIDNARGYVQDNVRFVALMANLARQDFTDADVRTFCRAVAANDVRARLVA